MTAGALQASKAFTLDACETLPSHLRCSLTAKGQDVMQGATVCSAHGNSRVEGLQDFAPVCLGLWARIFHIPAKLREGAAGQVTRLGQGGQSGSVLGYRGQKLSAGGGAGQGAHGWEGGGRVCCLWSWNR